MAAHKTDPLLVEIVTRLALGEYVVTRIVTSKYFTYEIDGHEVVVTDEMKQEMEKLAGAELSEYKPKLFPGERALQFPPEGLPAVRAALEKRGWKFGCKVS